MRVASLRFCHSTVEVCLRSMDQPMPCDGIVIHTLSSGLNGLALLREVQFTSIIDGCGDVQ